MTASPKSQISRRTFISSAALTIAGTFLPQLAFGIALSEDDGEWSELYRDEEVIIYISRSGYKAVNLLTGAETVSKYTEGDKQTTITDASGITHVAEQDEAGNVYVDGVLVFEVVYDSPIPPSAANGCVKLSEYNTTLSAKNSTDSVIMGALSFLPFYGWIISLTSFAKSVFDLVGNRGEVYFHCVRYYCDTPKPHQQLTTYAYSDAAHKHLLRTNTQTINV